MYLFNNKKYYDGIFTHFAEIFKALRVDLKQITIIVIHNIINT